MQRDNNYCSSYKHNQKKKRLLKMPRTHLPVRSEQFKISHVIMSTLLSTEHFNKM